MLRARLSERDPMKIIKLFAIPCFVTWAIFGLFPVYVQ
jgi:hypothetical protein